jgi:hypothetical protein
VKEELKKDMENLKKNSNRNPGNKSSLSEIKNIVNNHFTSLEQVKYSI